MFKSIFPYAALCMASVFLASVSQAMLKKAAMRRYSAWWREYCNPLVISAYAIFFATTWMNVAAYRGMSVSLGAVLETTAYLYVTLFGVVLFKEKITKKKALALALIVAGILLYSLGT